MKNSPHVSGRQSRSPGRRLRVACSTAAVFGAAAILCHASANASDVPGSQTTQEGRAGPQLEAQAQPDGSAASFDADAQQSKLSGIETGASERLGQLLRDHDPVVAAAAFGALVSRNYRAAVRELLEVIDDTTEPVRLQALQLLLASPSIEDATVIATLRSALTDPDPGMVECATQALIMRGDPAASSALTGALREGSVASRLLIVGAMGNDEAARQYLYYALRDPDDSVREKAEEVLYTAKIEASNGR